MLPSLLIEGYAKFRQFKYARYGQRYMRLAVESQKPKVMVIACCDSRAAPETIFDAGPGELFVLRNVANLVPPYAPDGERHSTSAALEYAVHSLGVEHVVVMGHGRCGGIASVIGDADPLSKSDFIGKWMSDVRALATCAHVDASAHEAEHARLVERASVVQSLKNLQSFPWISALMVKGELQVHGVWFDIALGELHSYDEATQSWHVISPNVP